MERHGSSQLAFTGQELITGAFAVGGRPLLAESGRLPDQQFFQGWQAAKDSQLNPFASIALTSSIVGCNPVNALQTEVWVNVYTCWLHALAVGESKNC